MTKPLKIDFVSDVACPWCAVGLASFERALERLGDDVPTFGASSDMGRPAQPEEISPAYVFLASPVTASYVNGVILPVMGGPRG